MEENKSKNLIDHIRKKAVGHVPEFIGIRRLRKSAVCIPLVEKDGKLHVLFEVRSTALSKQPGDICFPGGMQEHGEDLEETAKRETCEELKLSTKQIEIIGKGDKLIAGGLVIHSFIGLISDYQNTYSGEEVDHVFLVPLEDIMKWEPEVYYLQRRVDTDDPDFPFERICNGKNYRWRRAEDVVYFYEYQGRYIWGMTAKIWKAFAEMIRNEERT